MANSDDEAKKEMEGESSHGLKTVTSTSSVQEYFAAKMKALKEKRKARSQGEEDSIGEQASDPETERDSKAGQMSRQEERVPAVFGAVGFSYNDPVQDNESGSAREAGLDGYSGDHSSNDKGGKEAGLSEDRPDEERRKKKKKKKNKRETADETLEEMSEKAESGENHHNVCDGTLAELDAGQEKKSKSRKRKQESDKHDTISVENVGKSAETDSSEEGGKKKKRRKMGRDEADDGGNGNEDSCKDKMKEKDESGSLAVEVNDEDKRKKKKKTKRRKDTYEAEEDKEHVNSTVKTKKVEDNCTERENKKIDDGNGEDEVNQADELARDETSNKSKGKRKKKKRKSCQVDDSNISQNQQSQPTPEPSSDRKRKRAKYFSKEESDCLKNAFTGSNIIEIKGYKYNEPPRKRESKKKRGH